MLRFYAQLQTVTVGEDVIQGRRFDSLQSSIGEAEGWSRHEIYCRRVWFFRDWLRRAGIPEWSELVGCQKTSETLEPLI